MPKPVRLIDLPICRLKRWTRPVYVSPSVPEQPDKTWPAPWDLAEGLLIYDGVSYAVYLPFGNAPDFAIQTFGGPWRATGTGIHDLTLEGSVGSSPPNDPKGQRHWAITNGVLKHI